MQKQSHLFLKNVACSQEKLSAGDIPGCGRGLMSLCIPIHFGSRRSIIHARMHMDDSHGMVAWVSSPGIISICPLHRPSCSLLDFYVYTVSLSRCYVRHVMSVTLAKLFKSISNENRKRNNIEMHTSMKPNKFPCCHDT